MAITWQQRRSIRRRINRRAFERAEKLPHFQIRYKIHESGGIPDLPTDLIAPWEGEWCASWSAHAPSGLS